MKNFITVQELHNLGFNKFMFLESKSEFQNTVLPKHAEFIYKSSPRIWKQKYYLNNGSRKEDLGCQLIIYLIYFCWKISQLPHHRTLKSFGADNFMASVCQLLRTVTFSQAKKRQIFHKVYKKTKHVAVH